MSEAPRPVAVVTGASSGIGEATALALARRGYALVLGARRLDRLEAVAAACRQAGGEGLPVPTDVTRPEQVEALYARAVDAFGRLDVAVNNAGIGHFARVHETSDEDMRRVFDVNFFGVFYGARAAARVMAARRGGHIFNVSSVLGKRGSPFHGAYAASKFAIVGLGDALRVEMKPYGVRVTTVCPALTATEFFQHSARGRKAQSSFVRWKRMMAPEKVARRIVAAVGRNRPEIVLTAGGRFLAKLAALWPSAADALMKVYHDDLARKLLRE